MNEMEINDMLNSIIAPTAQNSSNLKSKSIHTTFVEIYKEPNLYLLFEEKGDNRNENNDPFIKEFTSFCDNENNIKETQPN